MTTHTPDCGGEDAPWCSTACVEANTPPALVDLEALATWLRRSPRTIRNQLQPATYDFAGRALYDVEKATAWFEGVEKRRRRSA